VLLKGTQHTIRRAGKSEETKDMETKATHTFEELKQAATAQHLRIEEKDGKYRVVRTLSEKFGLVAVKAGAGYSLDYAGLRKFLISNSVDIGAMLTDWSIEFGHSHRNQKGTDTYGADLEHVH
jgi:hypothetical protein